MLVTHNPPIANPEFQAEMKLVLASQPQAAAYVLQELKSNPEFLDAAYHGSAMLEGQDGTIYTLALIGNEGVSLWEARWTTTFYTSVGSIPLTQNFLFQVTLPTP